MNSFSLWNKIFVSTTGVHTLHDFCTTCLRSSLRFWVRRHQTGPNSSHRLGSSIKMFSKLRNFTGLVTLKHKIVAGSVRNRECADTLKRLLDFYHFDFDIVDCISYVHGMNVVEVMVVLIRRIVRKLLVNNL